MDCKTFRLDNGLRVVLMPSASEVVYCGIAVRGGTRDEQPGEEGLAHLCEHLSFKGTRRRTAVQIINALEGVGGELNAFTTKEDTVYYATVTRRHLSRALDVLSDIVFESQYPQAELEKEREVVCDEIESYEDSPAELIFDEFENILFEGHPLGHNILGSQEQVRAYQSADVQRFARRYYRPENCVLFVSGGSVPPKLGSLPPKLGGWGSERATSEPIESGGWGSEREDVSGNPNSGGRTLAGSDPQPPDSGGLITRHRGTHQAHVMLGTRTFGATDERRWALFLLNNVLGGPSLNSRLNLALRERRGLVYTVESQMTTYSDTGLWTVYFGCDPADVRRCLRLVRSELDRLIKRPLSATQLARAKRQLRGQLTIAAENREQFALDMAKTFLHEGRQHSLDFVLSKVDALTPQMLQATACQLFAPERLTTLVYD